MKICLISPPTVAEFSEGFVAEAEAMRLIVEHAPMGILSLAAVLEAQGYSPLIIDLNRLYYDYALLGLNARDGFTFNSYVLRHLEPLAFDVFGFSSVCSSYPSTLRLAEGVSLTHPGAKIILGGPQASVVDVSTMKAFPFVDCIVRGEAEETLPLLLNSLSTNASGLSYIRGITYREGDEVKRNPNAPVIEDLDSLPMAALHLYPRIENCSYVPLEAGRGCPFACSFCSTNDFFRRRFRMKSPSILIEQMRRVKERYGITSFDLVHDMFTIDRKRVISFCNAVSEAPEQFYWSCSARTDCIDDELIKIMSEAGCRGVFFGIDTGSERMQKIIDKGLDLNDALARIKSTERQGISTTVSLITGFHEETKEDLRATVRFFGEALRHDSTELQLHLLAPLAATPITTQFKEQLVYDDIFSDMSFHGWEQDPEDRSMIMKHREIFPNFYAVPTPWLDRHYLKEVREFLLHGITKHRLLMLTLYQDSTDLLSLFDEWQRWCTEVRRRIDVGSRARNYYASTDFSDDLISFARDHYSRIRASFPHLVRTMTSVEEALLSLRSNQPSAVAEPAIDTARTMSFEADAIPVIKETVRTVTVEGDYKRLVRCLRRKGRLDRIPYESTKLVLVRVGEKIKVMQLNQVTCQLLCLCDGSRSAGQVANNFSTTKQIEGVSTEKAGLYGLALLSQQGLIDIKSPSLNSP